MHSLAFLSLTYNAENCRFGFLFHYFIDYILFQMAQLLNNEYSDILSNYTVIDCRYPYEYDGGHIKVDTIIYILLKLASSLNLSFFDTSPNNNSGLLIFINVE